MHNLLTRGYGFIGTSLNSKTMASDSKESSNDTLATQWIDFRTVNLDDLGLVYTDGVQINQDSELGLWASGTGGFYERLVKFTSYQWSRAEELPFSFVFTTKSDSATFLFGLGSSAIDVNNLGDQALFTGDIQIFLDSSKAIRFFGGGGVYNWVQDIDTNIGPEEGVFYKVSFEKSGEKASKIYMHTVESSNFEMNINFIGEYTIGNNPANSSDLVPIWNAVSTPNVFITGIGFKIG